MSVEQRKIECRYASSIQSLHVKVRCFKRKMIETEKQLEELQMKNDEKNETNEDELGSEEITNRKEYLRKQIEACESKMNEMKEEMEREKRKIQCRLNSQKQPVEVKLKCFRNKLVEMEKNREMKESPLNALEKESEETRHERENLLKQIEEYERELKEKNDEYLIEQKKRECRYALQKQSIEVKLNCLQSQVDEIKKKLQQLGERNEVQNDESKGLNREDFSGVQAGEVDKETLKERLKTLEKTITESRNELRQLEKKEDSEKQQLESQFHQNVDMLRRTIESLKKDDLTLQGVEKHQKEKRDQLHAESVMTHMDDEI